MNRIIRIDTKLRWYDKWYIPRIIQGLWRTLIRFFRKPFTIQYPEKRRFPGGRYRGIHRLSRDWRGRIKCVACYMCATACPSKCITIVAAKAPWPDRDKYPESFIIDELRCIFCGLCEYACPENAIHLTPVYEFSKYNRKDFIMNKEELMKNHEWWSLPQYSKEYIKQEEIEEARRKKH